MSLQHRDWYNPLCNHAYDVERWDLTVCFQTTTLALLPILVLFLSGSTEFFSVWAAYTSGNRPEKGGVAAYRLKLVSWSREAFAARPGRDY